VAKKNLSLKTLAAGVAVVKIKKNPMMEEANGEPIKEIHKTQTVEAAGAESLYYLQDRN
jgi:hypothetical protein